MENLTAACGNVLQSSYSCLTHFFSGVHRTSEMSMLHRDNNPVLPAANGELVERHASFSRRYTGSLGGLSLLICWPASGSCARLCRCSAVAAPSFLLVLISNLLDFGSALRAISDGLRAVSTCRAAITTAREDVHEMAIRD